RRARGWTAERSRGRADRHQGRREEAELLVVSARGRIAAAGGRDRRVESPIAERKVLVISLYAGLSAAAVGQFGGCRWIVAPNFSRSFAPCATAGGRSWLSAASCWS